MKAGWQVIRALAKEQPMRNKHNPAVSDQMTTDREALSPVAAIEAVRGELIDAGRARPHHVGDTYA